jgi:hypothetical protein
MRTCCNPLGADRRMSQSRQGGLKLRTVMTVLGIHPGDDVPVVLVRPREGEGSQAGSNSVQRHAWRQAPGHVDESELGIDLLGMI